MVGAHAPLSGSAAIFSGVHRSAAAYFEHVNATEGGVSGCPIRYVLRDDGYPSPTQARVAAQRLVEEDGVLATLFNFGTPTRLAAVGCLDEQGVPDLFFGSGAAALLQPLRPGAFAGLPAYADEGAAVAAYLDAERPGARVALLHQDDDFGRDYRAGFTAAASAAPLAEHGYDATAIDVSSQVADLLESDPDVVLLACPAQPCASAVRTNRGAGSDAEIAVAGVSAVSGPWDGKT